jgi:transcriptional regulator with XRE-family HTH domain
MDFSEKLKHSRLALNLSQSELSEKTGISERTIYSYEQLGKFPRSGNILKLSDALGVTPNYLLGRSDGISDSAFGAFDASGASERSERGEFLMAVREKFGKKGAAEAEELLLRTSALFAGGEIDEDSKDAFFRSLMEVYLESKTEAADKYGAKNKRNKRSRK